MAADKIDTIVSLSKRRGFVFPCSEIYGGQRAAWDYGPLGVELKENIKRQWWRYMVTSREDVVAQLRRHLEAAGLKARVRRAVPQRVPHPPGARGLGLVFLDAVRQKPAPRPGPRRPRLAVLGRPARLG